MTQPTVGRILHAYSSLWKGPRPATVVNVFDGGAGVSHANVNVHLDGANDAPVLAAFRASSAGNTLTSVDVYPSLDPEQRDRALQKAPDRMLPGPLGTAGTPIKVICEWPPQAPRVPLAKETTPGVVPEAAKKT